MHIRSISRAAVVIAFVAGCRPDVDEPASIVTEARVAAVKIEPPEAAPGASVLAHALVVSKDGTVDDARLEWALCRTPKSPAEDRTINPACLEDADAVGEGTDAMFALPDDACALFGPETPPGQFRPRDPDSTGGYYQPVRVRLAGADSVALERLLCNPRNAAADVAAEFLRTYRPNENPTLSPVVATLRGAAADLEDVAPGARVRFVAAWAQGDDEAFLMLDPSSQTIAPNHEVLRVSWYATGGHFADDRTGEDARGAARSSNDWTAPSSPGRVHFWAVVRDSRGGQDFVAWDAVVVGR